MISHLATLTEQQKSCLRLVAKGMSSKEIAKELKLSPQTVDTYLKISMARLEASNRRDAARILLEIEVSQKLGPHSGTIAEPSVPSDDQSQISITGFHFWNRLPPIGGITNDLNWAQRTIHVLQIAVTGSAVVIALALAIAGVFKTFA